MTTDLLRQRVFARLTELRADKVNNLRRCKPRAPMQLQDGGVIAASTAEEIALYAVDTNATIDALDTALNILAEEFKRITTPEQPDAVEAGGNTNQARRPAYG